MIIDMADNPLEINRTVDRLRFKDRSTSFSTSSDNKELLDMNTTIVSAPLRPYIIARA